LRIDLQRGVRARSGRAADQQGQHEALALHFRGDVAHFFQRRRDQAGQADDVGVLGLRAVEDHLRGHHHAQVDDLEVVARQHHADDVLADVVHVALDRRHDDLAVVLARIARAQLFGFDVGQQPGDRLLHHARGLHHLRQEHLACAEQIADHVHARHQRAFDHVQRARGLQARFLGIGVDVRIDAVDQRMREAVAHRLFAPAQVFDLLLAFLALEAFGDLEQALGAVAAAIEHDVLDALAQLRVDVVVERQCTGVDDAHVHARGDRVVQEHDVDRLPHGFVAAEGEGDVRHAAGDVRQREAACAIRARLR
jgi:hypothetical protein